MRIRRPLAAIIVRLYDYDVYFIGFYKCHQRQTQLVDLYTLFRSNKLQLSLIDTFYMTHTKHLEEYNRQLQIFLDRHDHMINKRDKVRVRLYQ